MAKLKVYVVPTGFHDAYVAAPSQKAALKAWGSEHDLFARGLAQVVTDAALTAEPLAKPGEVVKRSRGTTAEQIAALPDAPRAEPAAEAPAKTRTPAAKALPKPKPKPKPSRDALDAAGQALAEAEARHREQEQVFAERQATLDRERRACAAAWKEERAALSQASDDERARYDRAVAAWRG